MSENASDNRITSLAGSLHVRLAAAAALLLLISAPFVIVGADLGLRSMFNAPLLWVDREAEARRPFNEFLELFGSHDLVVVSWIGCDVNDERLVRAAKSLAEIQESRAIASEETLFNCVLTGKTMLDALTSMPIDLSPRAAVKRLTGVVVGDDGETSALVVELTEYGAINRRKTIDVLTNAVIDATNLTRDQLILSGPVIDGMAIDDESMRSIKTYSVPSILISLVLCWWCLRSVWLTIPILIVGGWAQAFMLATIYYSGQTMNAVLIVLPALVFVLTVSVGVHLAHYFLEEVDKGRTTDAPRLALRNATGPCVLAAVTTAIGLASLGISSVEPVRQFGYLGAMGVLACVALLFLLLPGFMVFWLVRQRYIAANQNSTHERATEETAVPRLPVGFSNEDTLDDSHRHEGHIPKPQSQPGERTSFRGFADWICRYALVIRLVCLIAMVGCGVGLFKLRTSIDVTSLLSEDNQAIQDFYWIEDNIGPLVPIEVVIHFDSASNVNVIDRLKIVAAVQNQISQIDNLHGSISAITFIPSFPRLRGVGSTMRKTVFLQLVNGSRDELKDAHYLAENADGESWRIGARIRGQANFDYGQFLEQLQSKVDEVLTKADEAGFEGVSSYSTGVLVLVYRIQELLLADLFQSFLTALVLVAIVMMISLRSIPAGLLAMLPNVFPTLILFGMMGWAEHAIDIGTVMTASVALGIAVDGTFHFLKWFTLSIGEGETNERAIAIAYNRCGGALVQTTLICACGLLIYTFSGFLPVRHFAWVLLMMLVAALLGDLILLPALLNGRLGNQLRRAQERKLEKKTVIESKTRKPEPAS